MTTPEKIGILGGTFDPPHWAHLRVAAHFARLFQLDRLLLIPSGNPWQKSAFITPPETRYQLTEAAAIALNRLLGDEGMQIPIEVDRIYVNEESGLIARAGEIRTVTAPDVMQVYDNAHRNFVSIKDKNVC